MEKGKRESREEARNLLPFFVGDTAMTYPKPRYSVREAMELLGIKRTRFYEHVKSGRLKVIKDGRKSFVVHDDLVALAETSAPSGVARS
jgi:excisionase family DNA binding protein